MRDIERGTVSGEFWARKDLIDCEWRVGPTLGALEKVEMIRKLGVIEKGIANTRGGDKAD